MAIPFKKIFKRLAISLLAIVVLVLIVFTGWREFSQYRVAKEREIQTENGIEALEKVEIGGIDQWISIRGRDLDNPIILYLHGGPGTPMMPFSHIFQTPWEEYFTVVQWDQRLTGKTYRESDPDAAAATISFDRMVEDARELSEYLIKRFGKKKIFLLGHSWGSMMGIPLVKRYPELFHAYIGTGQVISVYENESVGYEHALEAAREQNNLEAIEALEGIAPYPHPETGTLDTRDVLRYWQRELGLSLAGKKQWFMEMLEAGLVSPDYSLLDINLLFNIPREHRITKIPAMATMIDEFDLWELGPDFEVPVVFLLGRLDWQVPSVIAKRYFDAVQAPYKKFIWFEESAHSPPTEEKEKFVEALVSEVLPLASDQTPGNLE